MHYIDSIRQEDAVSIDRIFLPHGSTSALFWQFYQKVCFIFSIACLTFLMKDFMFDVPGTDPYGCASELPNIPTGRSSGVFNAMFLNLCVWYEIWKRMVVCRGTPKLHASPKRLRNTGLASCRVVWFSSFGTKKWHLPINELWWDQTRAKEECRVADKVHVRTFLDVKCDIWHC